MRRAFIGSLPSIASMSRAPSIGGSLVPPSYSIRGGGRFRGGGLELGDQRSDGDRAARASLIHHLHGEAIVHVILGVEEKHMIVPGGEHAAQPLWQLWQRYIGAVDVDDLLIGD